MRNLLALVGLAVIAFGVVGWYNNWYTITVDKSKVMQDAEKWYQEGKDKLKEGEKAITVKENKGA